MKVAIIKPSLIARTGCGTSLQASDYLCPDDALLKSIDQLEKQAKAIQTSLANKRAELAERRRKEAVAIAREELTLLVES